MLFWMLLQGLKEAINYDVFIVQHGKAVAVYGSSPKGIHLREQAFRKPIQTEHYTVVGFDYLRVLYDNHRFFTRACTYSPGHNSGYFVIK